MRDEIRPFIIQVPDEILADLHVRLLRTRWPEAAPVDDWSQGIPLDYLKNLCHYWIHNYDWRSRERMLNELPQFLTTIDGVDIHFVHVRSVHNDALPLILTHGWPGSFVEFFSVIDRLTDPVPYGGDAAEAFHVVIPSLPGYGWSGKPTSTGWGVERIASAWAVLMSRLGYQRYGAQGGDWGAVITTSLARQDAPHIEGIHLNIVLAGPSPGQTEFSEAEREALESVAQFNTVETGYMHVQSTRPQTIGYALNDSPVGQCAWIVEKLAAWSDSDWDPVATFGADQILDNVMMYWLPANAASSARLYWESARDAIAGGGEVHIPVGVSVFPKETLKSTREWASRDFHDLRFWNEVPVGGHFAAFEQGELFVAELRSFFKTFRRTGLNAARDRLATHSVGWDGAGMP